MVRHIRWQILLVVLGTILAGALLSYQAVGVELELVPASGGTLVEALVGQPQYLNPLLSFNNPVDRDICALVFEGLTRYDEHGQLVPALASGWHISGDGLVYTFWLRQDVRWQDGIGFSADDVLFTIQLLQDPGYTGPADLGVLWNSVEIERLNRWTVTMTLQEPFAPFLDFTTIGMLPVHLLDGVTAAELPDQPFNRSPIGTGPFRIEESDWESGRLLLGANGLYREGKIPNLTGVEFQFFPDYGSALTAYEQDQVNSVGRIVAADMPRARALEGMSLYTSSLPRVTMILLNLRSEELAFFQERGVRQALLMGLDRPALIADVLNGQGMVAHSPIFPGSWAYYGEVTPYGHDPERAAQRLDAAGWLLPEREDSQANLVESETLAGGVRSRQEQEEELELSFSLLAAANTTHHLLAEEIARQWAELGIRVTVDAVEPGRISQLLEVGDFQAAVIDLDMRGDPDLYSLWSESAIQEGQNYGGWRHREASELLEQARQLTNVGQRTTRYYHFQQVFAEEVPALLLYFQTYTYGISDQVQQVSIGPLTTPSDRFASVSDWFLVWREVVIRKSSPRLGNSW
jgi:peptide/nickel transport system substrate-binding protein